MTTDTPPPNDFLSQVQRFLDEGSSRKPANWALHAVLQAARVPRKGLSGMEELASPYARLLQDGLALILEDLRAGKEPWLADVEVVFLVGPAAIGTASPYRTVVAGEPLPPETSRLMGLVYDWLFTFLGKSSALNGTRFLDDDLMIPVEIWFYFSNPENFSEEKITACLNAAFVERLNFTPPLLCRVKTAANLTTRTALTSHCLYGWGYVEERLRETWSAIPKPEVQVQFQHAVAVTRRALTAGGESLGEVKANIERRIVQHYRKVKQDKNSSVSLDYLTRDRVQTSSWRDKNRVFFTHIQDGQYDRLLIEDATKGLDDRKGAEKENRFTISRVLGLEFDGQIIPAHEMVLKLRGFTHYRGDINNWLDLLKEYMSYTIIHQRVEAQLDYILEIGPLLLTCERLDVPFDTVETSHWIGFFMEALSQMSQGQIFTCRVLHLSDFWAPEQAIGWVLQASRRDGVVVEESSLRMQLRKLALWLWEYGLSVNYCDLVLYLDQDGRVEALRIIDLERLSFSELVGETHLLLDTMVDIKTHLRKEPWVHVLLNMFRSREDPQGFPSLRALQVYLNPKSRWRLVRLGFWRGLRWSLQRLYPARGAQLWVRLSNAWVRLNDFILRRVQRGNLKDLSRKDS